MPAKQRKIAVMGSRSVGKSSLAIQFVQGQFVDSYDPTIENTFTKVLKYRGQEYEVLVVDTAGQDEYSIFPTQYSVDIDGYILVYSIDSEKSFEVVQIIYDKLVDLVGNANVPLVLVGNKNDLHNDRRITQEAGKKLAGDMKAMFLETSAKDNQCASDIFIKSLIQIEKMENKMALDTLPDLVLENILKYFSYDEIAKFRSISTKFNLICKSMLTKGFKAVEKYHLKCLKEMKGKLPRRESERRDHPLARHCDILTAIETRISLLGMTFMKFIELDLCCFIPGKVIDEIYSVLRNIQSIKNPNRSCEVLQELRDISSMAMEYFDEKIAPGLRLYPASPNRLNSGYFSGIFSSGTGFSLSMRYSDSLSPPSTPLCRLPLNQAVSEPVPRARPSFMRALQTTAKTPNRKPSVKASRLVRDLKKQADSYKTAVESQNKKMLELDRRIDQQNELINEQNARLAEQEEKLAQMSRRLSENTSQFTEMDEGKSKMMTKIDLGMRMHPCSSSSSQPALSCETLPRGENTNSRFGEDENVTRPRKRGRSDDIKV